MSESPGPILTALRAAFSPPCPSRRHPGPPAWDAKAGPRRAPAPAPPPPPARSRQPPGAGGAEAGPEGRGVSDVQGLGLSSALPLGPPASRGWRGCLWAGFGRRPRPGGRVGCWGGERAGAGLRPPNSVGGKGRRSLSLPPPAGAEVDGHTQGGSLRQS